ncbi:phage head closure protein [Niallia sp. FSL W8-1348]|uniref:phage head closure protein n=1 Tax=Niallia sp. FSL W8-1348 TaxID=2954656 RepID=UPI0030F7FA3F
MKQKLIFQIPSGGTDEDGFPIDEPSTYTTAWGSLKTLKGSSFFSAARDNLQHNRVFTIRYQRRLMDDVRPSNLQVLWRGISHQIESIENDDGLNISMTVILKAVS